MRRGHRKPVHSDGRRVTGRRKGVCAQGQHGGTSRSLCLPADGFGPSQHVLLVARLHGRVGRLEDGGDGLLRPPRRDQAFGGPGRVVVAVPVAGSRRDARRRAAGHHEKWVTRHQPGRLLQCESGCQVVQVGLVEQQDRAAAVSRGGEQLPQRHEDVLARAGRTPVEECLQLVPAPGRQPVEQVRALLGPLAQGVGDAAPGGTRVGRRGSDEEAGAARLVGGDGQQVRSAWAGQPEDGTRPLRQVADGAEQPRLVRVGQPGRLRLMLALGDLGDEAVATTMDRLDHPLVPPGVPHRPSGQLDPAGQG